MPNCAIIGYKCLVFYLKPDLAVIGNEMDLSQLGQQRILHALPVDQFIRNIEPGQVIASSAGRVTRMLSKRILGVIVRCDSRSDCDTKIHRQRSMCHRRYHRAIDR